VALKNWFCLYYTTNPVCLTLKIYSGRYDLLDRLRAYKVRPAGNQPPDKFETGTKGL
jgi:hypothetical protein